MSHVYVAESLSSGVQKPIVLKVLSDELAADPLMRTAFLREAEISARLNHPNVVQVFEVFEQGSTLAIVMQYLDGLPLSEILHRTKRDLPLELHLHVLRQLLAGLHYVHELQDEDGSPLHCVHRDVSPQNVIVLYEGGVKVVDFGIAKVPMPLEEQTRAGIVKGKLRYMSPEQWLGQTGIDRRADIYSLGVMLWEAAAKQRMWATDDPRLIARAVVRGELPSIRDVAPQTSDELVAIIERALAADRTARYASAEEMQRELEALLTASGDAYARQWAAFMHQHFQEQRRQRQAALREAIRTSKTGSRESDVDVGGHGTADRPAAGSTRDVAPVAPGPSPRVRRFVRTSLIAGAVLALGCMAAHLTAGHSDTSAPRELTAHASSESSALRMFSPRAQPEAMLSHEVDSAPGVDEARSEPTFVSLSDSDEGRSARSERRRRRRRDMRARASDPEHAAFLDVEASEVEGEQSRIGRCTPPYRLERDGVKTFDPECF